MLANFCAGWSYGDLAERHLSTSVKFFFKRGSVPPELRIHNKFTTTFTGSLPWVQREARSVASLA